MEEGEGVNIFAGRNPNKRKPQIKSFICVLLIFCLFFLFINFILAIEKTIGKNIIKSGFEIVSLLTDSGKKILKEGLPLLSAKFVPEESLPKTPEDLVKYFLYFFTRVNIEEPTSFITSCIGFLSVSSMAEYMPVEESAGLMEAELNFFRSLNKEKEEKPEEKNSNVPLLSQEPLVAVYTTHNSETYIPTDGTAKIEGENAGIAKVAETLATTLENQYGIKTICSKTIHDYPRWERSYVNSGNTLQKILEKYPSIEVVIDVHRDAGLPEKSVTTLANGERGATIMLVVGTDKRLPHPHWQENWEFAKKIGRKMDELYPGLLKEIRIQSGRYNQHLHKRAILAEIGSTKNTLEEACEAARALARVINEIIKDDIL